MIISLCSAKSPPRDNSVWAEVGLSGDLTCTKRSWTSATGQPLAFTTKQAPQLRRKWTSEKVSLYVSRGRYLYVLSLKYLQRCCTQRLQAQSPPLLLTGVQLCQSTLHLRHREEETFPAGSKALLQQWTGDWHVPQQADQSDFQALAEEAVPQEHRL